MTAGSLPEEGGSTLSALPAGGHNRPVALHSAAQRGILIEDLTGRDLGQYHVLEQLGVGGMAVVYRAVQGSLGRDLALKVLSPALVHQEGFLQRFESEARTLARLDHPYILPIYDFSTIAGYTFIVSPLVRGGTLRACLAGRPMQPQAAIRYLTQVADALHHAHQVGVIHRDLKPSNVLIHADGRCVLADFGLARGPDSPSGLTIGGFAMGTPGYMSPEQALGSELTPRADIYSLAVIAFEMLAGSRPYQGGDPHKLVMATVHEPVPSVRERNPELSAQVQAVVEAGLAKDPDRRPASAVEFVHGLTSALMATITTSAPAPKTALAGVGSPDLELPSPPPSRSPETPSATASNPTVSTLEHMGLRRPRAVGSRLMNSFFADALHAAEHVAGDHWMEMLAGAGLEAFNFDSPPEDGELGAPIEYLGRLAEGLERIFGTQSPDKLRQWGHLVVELDLEQDRSAAAERRSLRLIPGQQRRLGAVLKGFVRRLDSVRGGELHAWKQLDADQFWFVIYGNALVAGRRKPDKACAFWTAALEARLRWAGLANDWTVSELECGATNGGNDCVFAVRSARAR